jgi:hypothetical protein
MPETVKLTSSDVGTIDAKDLASKKPTKNCFCAQCQKDTAHEISVAQNRETILTCVGCKGFKKFAPGTKKEDIEKFLAAHKEGNKGQISAEKQNKEMKELTDQVLKDLAD